MLLFAFALGVLFEVWGRESRNGRFFWIEKCWVSSRGFAGNGISSNAEEGDGVDCGSRSSGVSTGEPRILWWCNGTD